MRHPLTARFFGLGLLGLALGAGFPLYPVVNRHSAAMHPNGYIQDERRTYPFAVTGAGFAVCGGLCFLAAALVNVGPPPARVSATEPGAAAEAAGGG
jgi:hypothetical protein